MRQEHFIDIEGSLKLWVETYGSIGNQACMFISGAGANSSFWSERLCNKLVEDGFFVIKYDHRDFGYTTKLNFEKDPYDVMDLAKDAISVLDALNVNSVHVIGHSMGGFIAQLLGIYYPDRVLSMTSASSSTSSPTVPMPPDKTWDIFLAFKPGSSYEEDLQGFMPVWEYLNGTAVFDKELAIEYTRNIYDRQEVKGALGESHVKAQANLKDRTEALKQCRIPTLVIHGEEDYLVDKYGGIQTAACIENAELVLIPKMGHLPFNQEVLLSFENRIIRFLNENQ